MAKKVAVIGCDGPIGCAVANSLENAFEVTRISFYDTGDLIPKLKGVDGCFVASYTDFRDTEKEIEQGQVIAKACHFVGIQHVILSTQINSLRAIGVMARNLVNKANIEEYMRELQLPLTCIMVPCLYEDLLGDLKPERVDEYTFRLAIPMGINSLDLVSSDDLGDVIKTVFTHKNEYLSKTVSVSGDKITVKEMADKLSRYLAPLYFSDKQVTIAQYAQQNKQANKVWAQDYANMFDFFGRFDQRYNVQRTKDMTKNPNIQNFDTWVKNNGARLQQAFLSS